MMKNKNPFLVYGYASPEYFCDRQEETQTLISAMLNGRNVTLMSPRRMGKTGLIQNAFYHLNESNPEIKCFYLDIYPTNSLQEFTKLLGQTILGQLVTKSEKWLGKITEFFKSCRPVVTSDAITGAPTVMLDFIPSNTEATLKEIFAYIKQSGKECVIAIDEFQQVTEYPEKGTEAMLRSFIQFIPNVHLIFSGSKRHLMYEMFSSPKRPFYQSTQKMNIDAIGKDEYYAFADKFLSHKGIIVRHEIFDSIYGMLHGHTWYMQRVLNKTYETGKGEMSEGDMMAIISSIIKEEEYNYQTQYNLLTPNQQNLLKAIASEDMVNKPNSQEFMQKYQLGATSSVNRALEALLKIEFVYDNGTGYEVYDRFFGMWLKNLQRWGI